VEDRSRTSPGLLFIFGAALGAHLGLTFMGLPPALDLLKDLYGLSYAGVAALISAIIWSHTALQIPAGLITDRIGIGRGLLASLLIIMGGGLLALPAPWLGLGMAGRVMSGVGTGLSFASAMKLMATRSPQGRTGFFQGVLGGFFSLGGVAAFLIVPLLTPLGWRAVYLVGTVSALLPLALLPGLKLFPASARKPASLTLGKILRSGTGWRLGLYHALCYGGMLTLGSWAAALLSEVWPGQTTLHLAWAGGLSMLVSGLGRLLGGLILFRIPPRPLIRLSLLCLSLSFLGLGLVSGPVPVIGLLILSSCFASLNFGAVFQLAAQAVGRSSAGTMMGLVNFIGNSGAIFSTMLFGYVKDLAGSLTFGFLCLAGLGLVSSLVKLNAEADGPGKSGEDQ
jgi:nitrate/nitrite transporter NarK